MLLKNLHVMFHLALADIVYSSLSSLFVTNTMHQFLSILLKINT